MDAFLGFVGFIAIIVGVIMLTINAIRKKRLITWGIVAGSGLVFFIVGLALSQGPQQPSAPTTTPTPVLGPRFVGRPDAQPKDIELLVGESAILEGLKLTLRDVKRLSSIPGSTAQTGKEFIIVSLRLENVDTKTHPYNSFDFRIQTAGGQVLDRAFETVEPHLGSGDLVAGGKVEGTVVFEVPREEGHQYILYKPNPFKADRIVVEMQ